MKGGKVVRKCIFLMILLPVLGCKTMTISVSLGGAVGAVSGAGLGGGIYWQDRIANNFYSKQQPLTDTTIFRFVL